MGDRYPTAFLLVRAPPRPEAAGAFSCRGIKTKKAIGAERSRNSDGVVADESRNAKNGHFSGVQLNQGSPVAAIASLVIACVMSLLNSRSHSTELATAAQRSQSFKLRPVVEKALWRNGT